MHLLELNIVNRTADNSPPLSFTDIIFISCRSILVAKKQVHV